MSEGSRYDSAQTSPPADLTGFPTVEIAAGDTLYRGTGGGRGPGYFSSLGGRFDLPTPDGTLYAARSIHCAVMERIAPPSQRAVAGERKLTSILHHGAVDEGNAKAITVYELAAQEALSVADLTDRRASTEFLVTGELSAGAGAEAYAMTQVWAEALHAAGCDGVEYHSRFVSSTDRDDNAIAVFGIDGVNLSMFAVVAEWSLLDVADRVGVTIRRSGKTVPAPSTIR